MSKLTIKSGCVEAVFKRGRERTKKGTERPTPVLRDAELETSQPINQSLDGGREHLVLPGEIEDFDLGEQKGADAGLPHPGSLPKAAGKAGNG